MNKPALTHLWDTIFDAEDDIRLALDLACLVNSHMQRAGSMSAEECAGLNRVTSDLHEACQRILATHMHLFKAASQAKSDTSMMGEAA
ncbi:hypothetical protein [Hyphomicrobium sp.]|uniref:hypothetical protein n=1 Tax=Hyphomicrobium sp. TaxID=82 RepID=UPI002FE3A9D7